MYAGNQDECNVEVNKDPVVLSMIMVMIGLLVKAHDDVINAAAMKNQNHYQGDDSKENIGDERNDRDA